MEGENKHSNRELLATLPAGGHYVPSSLSSFSHLILTLDSPFGRYQSCRVPLQRTADAHAPGIVNYVVEAGEELEERLEGLIKEVEWNGPRHRLASILLSQSVDVKREYHNSSSLLRVCGGLTLFNYTHIPLLVRCWLGSVMLFGTVVGPTSSVVTPPYASHLPYLRVQIQPLMCAAEEDEANRLRNLSAYHLDGFVFSGVDVQGSALAFSSIHRCYRRDVRECDEQELCQDISELCLALSARKQSHSIYELTVAPPVTIRNCLPIPLAAVCEPVAPSLPLFADSQTSLVEPTNTVPLYDHLLSRWLALAPQHMRCSSLLSLQSTLGSWVRWLKGTEQAGDHEAMDTTATCSDYDGNELHLVCHCGWFNGSVTIHVTVAFWLDVEVDLPLHFHVMTGREKEDDVCNQQFRNEQSQLLLLDSRHPVLTVGMEESSVAVPVLLRMLSQPEQSRSLLLTDRWHFGGGLRRTYSLLLSSHAPPSDIPLTTVLTLTPRIHLLNNTQFHLEALQDRAPSSEAVTILSNGRIPCFLLNGYPQALRLRLLNGNSAWSSATIPLELRRRSGTHEKHMYVKDGHGVLEFFHVRVCVRETGAVEVVINHSKYSGGNLPIVFSNHTLFPLRLRQHGFADGDVWEVGPYASCPLYWSDADFLHILEADVFEPFSRGVGVVADHLRFDCSLSRTRIQLNVRSGGDREVGSWRDQEDQDALDRFAAGAKIASNQSQWKKRGQRLVGSVEVLRSVVFVELKPFLSGDPLQTHRLLPQSSQSLQSLRVEVSLPSVQATLINADGTDLLCLCMDRVCVQLRRQASIEADLSIRSLQLCNQLMEAQYPVVLDMKPTLRLLDGSECCIHTRCVVCEGESNNYGHCVVVSSAECFASPMTLLVERCLITQLLRLRGLPSPKRPVAPLPTVDCPPDAYLERLRSSSRLWVHTEFPQEPRASPTAPMKTHTELYEESRHVRIQHVHMGGLSLSVSVSLFPQHSSRCRLFAVDSLSIALHPVILSETYPRRASYIYSQLLHAYVRGLLLQLPATLASLRSLGAPGRFVGALLGSLQSLAVDLMDSANGPIAGGLLSRLEDAGEALLRTFDRNVANLSLVTLDVASSLLSSVTLLFTTLDHATRPLLSHGVVTNRSPFLRSRPSYHSVALQTRNILLHLAAAVGSVATPLQSMLGRLQRLRDRLAGQPLATGRVRAPNVSIGGVVMLYDPVYSRGKEILMTVAEGRFRREDCLAVYSIARAFLIVTRNRLVLVRTRESRAELLCSVLLDDVLSVRTVRSDDRFSLAFIYFKPFDRFAYRREDLFQCGVKTSEVFIGNGVAAKQVCEKMEEIIQKELKNHDYGRRRGDRVTGSVALRLLSQYGEPVEVV